MQKNNGVAVKYIIKEDNYGDTKKAVVDIYKKSDVCLAELFSSIEIQGLDVEAVVKLYAELFLEIEEDEVVRKREGEILQLWNDGYKKMI